MDTWHIVEFYHHRQRECVLGQRPFRDLAAYCKAHDAYVLAHDKHASEAAPRR